MCDGSLLSIEDQMSADSKKNTLGSSRCADSNNLIGSFLVTEEVGSHGTDLSFHLKNTWPDTGMEWVGKGVVVKSGVHEFGVSLCGRVDGTTDLTTSPVLTVLISFFLELLLEKLGSDTLLGEGVGGDMVRVLLDNAGEVLLGLLTEVLEVLLDLGAVGASPVKGPLGQGGTPFSPLILSHAVNSAIGRSQRQEGHDIASHVPNAWHPDKERRLGAELLDIGADLVDTLFQERPKKEIPDEQMRKDQSYNGQDRNIGTHSPHKDGCRGNIGNRSAQTDQSGGDNLW
mmetsp:Transcript_21231/g.36239  ORF Transcript_21231/g.36239 Transcript_21231/m.36239 type:complete len:286 (+) Transcript_21231:326-1183(+)